MPGNTVSAIRALRVHGPTWTGSLPPLGGPTLICQIILQHDSCEGFDEAILMETDLKVGDVVRPKSGGPDMCIARFETDIVSGECKKNAVCNWFVGRRSQTGFYPVEMLEFVRQINDVS